MTSDTEDRARLRELQARMNRLVAQAIDETGLGIEEISILVDAADARERRARMDPILADVAGRRFELDAVMRFLAFPAETQSVQQRMMVLRWALRRLGRDNVQMIEGMLEPESHSEWRVIIRKREDSETPDRGLRRKKRAHALEVRNFGIRYHALIKSGYTQVAALGQTQKEGLCKSHDTGKKLLTEFNNPTRQYLDILAPDRFNATGELNVFPKRADVRRRGPKAK